MKTFYIANDDFWAVGHPQHTLRSLCEGNDQHVVLITQPQSPEFRSALPPHCTLLETLPSSEAGRLCPPPVLGAQIANALLAQGVGPEDLIVLKMPFPYLLLSVTYALSLSQVALANPRLSVLISQTDEGYAGEEILYSDCFHVISQLPPVYRDRIVLLHEREALRQHWQSLFPAIRSGLCGYVTEWFKRAAPPLGGDYRLTYLGEARGEKGFNVLAKALETGHLSAPLDVHCDANSNNINDAYHEAMGLFQKARSRQSPVQLIHQRRDNAYEAAFHSRSVALMLYSPEYRTRGSGVLQECAAAGMHVIAYEDLGFHLDYPENVLTITRTSDMPELARQIQRKMDHIAAGAQNSPTPNALTARDFRKRLEAPHGPLTKAHTEGPYVFVVTNNIHREGCSKIIEAQQCEILLRGLTPVYISFEWPDKAIEWSERVAFQRIWSMQMNSPKASYGFRFLTVPLITRRNVLEHYDTFQYQELVEISANVNNDILDTYLSWRSSPTVVMNYTHHAPILEGKLANFDRTFLEIHDITSIQQKIRSHDLQSDSPRFLDNIRLEVEHLRRFKHKCSLSPNESEFLAARGCPIDDHSYLDTFIRNTPAFTDAPNPIRENGFEGEYLCIVGSGHPSNVIEINRFCERELENKNRRLPIFICGLVCNQIRIPNETLARSGIHLMGFVPDISGVIRGALATLNPVDIGSGTPIKVYDSIANQTPCLVTARTVCAMPPHPLVIEFDFNTSHLRDDDIRAKAAEARSLFQRSEPGHCRPNKLGEFLDENRPR